MPIYEYRCPGCHLKFELLRSLSKSNQGASCPHCHYTAERILSVFSAVSKSESGVSSPVGGSSCAGCSSTGCNTCGM